MSGGGLDPRVPFGMFAVHLQKPGQSGQPTLPWRVDRREGDHWIELGHYGSKRLAAIGLAESVSRGEGSEDELRVRKAKD